MADDFLQLIDRVRGGDAAAIERLVDEYGGAIRREVRLHLLDARLRRVVSESDLFQSVVARFLFDLWAGRYDFERPEHLAGLLKVMARARVADAARHWTAARRDVRRDVAPEAAGPTVRPEPTPSQIVANREILQQALERLTERERRILEWRHDGVGWAEIAERLGDSSAEAVRKQFERALDRVAAELRIDDV